MDGRPYSPSQIRTTLEAHEEHDMTELIESIDMTELIESIDRSKLIESINKSKLIDRRMLLYMKRMLKRGKLLPPKESPQGPSVTKPSVIFLKSSDGETFGMDEDAADMSSMLGTLMKEGRTNDIVPLPTINASTLRKVVEFCTQHGDPDAYRIPGRLSEWDESFFGVETDVLVDLFKAAEDLGIKKLRVLCWERYKNREI